MRLRCHGLAFAVTGARLGWLQCQASATAVPTSANLVRARCQGVSTHD